MLSSCLTPGFGNMLPLLKQYHGLEIYIVENLGFQDTINLITAELAESRPVVIELDTFICTWDPGYQKYHYPHTNLIVGYDEGERLFSLIDCFYQKQELTIPSETCFSSEGNRLALFRRFSNPGPIDDWKKIITNAARRMLAREQNENAFDQMRHFAAVLEQAPDLSEEFNHYEHIWMAPLLSMFNTISNGRRQFSTVLQYLQNQIGQDFTEMTNEFHYVASQWSILLSMVTKAYYNSSDSGLLQRAANKLHLIAEKEEQIAIRLLDLCEEKRQNDLDSSKTHEVTPVKEQVKTQFVDLTEYYNNKGFDRSISHESKADFTLMGDYFFAEDWLGGQLRNNEGMTFSLPELSESMRDNLSCAAQSLVIPEGYYSSLLIMGCSECGNYSDRIEVLYADQSTASIAIAFTDWQMEPIFGEKIVWTGKGVGRKHGQAKLMDSPVRLFAQSYPLDKSRKIKSMQLPDCPNLHIFAMTFIVEER